MDILLFLLCPYSTIYKIKDKNTKYKVLKIIYILIYTLFILGGLLWSLKYITILNKPILIA